MNLKILDAKWQLFCLGLNMFDSITVFLQDKMQVTMIVTWLIEIYLNQLGVLKEQGEDMSEKYDRLQEEFRTFLAQSRVKVRRQLYLAIYMLNIVL